MKVSVIAFSIGFKLGKFIGKIIWQVEEVIAVFLNQSSDSKNDNVLAMELIR